MNENIDLIKILKNCPKGWKFYSEVYGDIEFVRLYNINNVVFTYKDENGCYESSIKSNGKLYSNGECVLFPSKDQRDWSKFTAPWYKKEKFDPKTLQPFDKVIVRNICSEIWTCGFFSHIVVFDYIWKYNVGDVLYVMCIPYNDDTKHLVGTKEEVPEYYRYWED